MSGYPYGNPTGGYPPQYVPGNPGYPNYPVNNNFQPPPIPVLNNNQAFPSPYGAPTSYMPNNNNYMPDNSSYMPNNNNYMPPPGNPYDYSSNINYQPPPPAVGFDNSPYQPSYPQETSSFSSSSLYPNIPSSSSTTAAAAAAASNYYNAGAAAPLPPPPYQPQNQQQQEQQQVQQQSFYPEQQQSILLASLERYQGTIFSASNFNADADCQALRQAMKGAGTNEQALIDIIVNRSNAQRQQIKHHYKSMFGMDLIKQIAGEISGHFRETITALFDTPSNFEAWSLHQALTSNREGTLREILLTRTNSEIRAIVEAYKRTFNKDLEKEINSRVRGADFRRILISAVQANRDELNSQQIQQASQMGIESVIDRNRAKQDADTLYKAGAGKVGTDEKTFNAIFSLRNYYQLRAIFEEYQNKYKKDMAKVIRSEFSGDIRDAYLVLITCIRDRPSFFAERIHKAIDGLGTNDSTLIRVIVTRSEIDLVQIKERYQQMYKRSLAQDVSGDTSGDYKRILLSIIK